MTTIRTEKFPELSYRKQGSGPAIVLIHGFPANGELWAQLLPLLAEKHTVIVPDLPGAGKSTFSGSGLSMEDMAESIRLVLEAGGIEQAVLAGHSMGGYVALAFAERYPQMLAGLSLVHSVASADNDEKKETRRKSIELITKGGKEAFIKQMIPNLFSAAFKTAHPAAVEDQVKKGMELEADSMVAFYEAMIARPERTKVLENADFPVQVIAGEDDALIPAKAALGQSRLSNRNFVSLYSGVGHMSMVEDPLRLAEDLKTFVEYCNKTRNQKVA